MRFDPILYEPEEESSPTELKPFIPDLGPERNTPTPQASPEHTVTRRAAPDPGLGVLFEQGDPNLGILMQPGMSLYCEMARFSIGVSLGYWIAHLAAKTVVNL